MTTLLHELIISSGEHHASRPALKAGKHEIDFASLAAAVTRLSKGLVDQGMKRFTRVAVYLPSTIDAVVSFFAVSAGGGIFVPVNAILKAKQVAFILEDSGAEFLVTSTDRWLGLQSELANFGQLCRVFTVDTPPLNDSSSVPVAGLASAKSGGGLPQIATIDEDPVAIFYTSGSTGSPKGVVLTHRNMVAGARSVASYLENDSDDSLLAVLPLSFDYGFSQLSTAFHSGARVVLLNYLVPNDVLRAAQRDRVTGLAGVPPLWIQLAKLDWPAEVVGNLRYLTNSGGTLPKATVHQLRQRLPATRVFLMYGLTEAFRSTYLAPDQVDLRPTSIGKAIPGAEVLVVRPDGSECGPNEPGELVHRGSLVASGYWHDPARTIERFRPVPDPLPGMPLPEVAVWSGDLVSKDEDGFLYFIGRNDELIKSSGYRVSPTEVEEALHASGLVSAAVAFGVEHDTLGQVIAAVVEPADDLGGDTDALLAECRKALPAFMVPRALFWETNLPRTPNGKLDRSQIVRHFRARIGGVR